MYLVESVRNVLSDRICRLRFGAHREGTPGSASRDGSWMSSHFEAVSDRFPKESNFSGSFVGCEKRFHLGQRYRVSATRPTLIMPPQNTRGSTRSREPDRWPDSRASEGERQHATAVPLKATLAWIYLLDPDDDEEMTGARNLLHFDRGSFRSMASNVRSGLRMTESQRAPELFRVRMTHQDREAPRLSPDRFSAGC